MRLQAIKNGHWYRTKVGVGQAVRVGLTSPPSVMINIVSPIPRGKCNVAPRDVLEEVPPPINADRVHAAVNDRLTKAIGYPPVGDPPPAA